MYLRIRISTVLSVISSLIFFHILAVSKTALSTLLRRIAAGRVFSIQDFLSINSLETRLYVSKSSYQFTSYCYIIDMDLLATYHQHCLLLIYNHLFLR